MACQNHPAIHATEQAEKYLNPDPTANFDTIDTLLSKGALEDLLPSIKAMNLPQLSGSTQPQASTIPPERLRKTLLPVILKNAQRRPDFNDKLVTKVEIGLREALTDQFCESLSQKLTTIGREIQATRGSEEDVHATAIASSTDLSLKLATVAPEDDQNLSTATPTTSCSVLGPPRAPRAMRSQDSARLTSQGSMESSASLPRSESEDTLPHDSGRLGHWPSGQELPARTAALAREYLQRGSRWDRPLQQHESNRIPIPLDSSFFTTTSTNAIRIKRESPDPSKNESSVMSHFRRSRSPQPRSLSISSRHSRNDTTHRRFSYYEISNRQLSPSPRPRSHRRRSRSHSRSRKARSPPRKRPRRSFSRSHSRPPGSHHSRSRARDNLRKQQLPPAHRGRSRSPHSRKASFHDHESSFRRGSPDPGPRRTPIHMRSIDRTRLSPSHRRGLILDRPGLPIHRISRSPEPLSTVSNVSRRHPSPPLYKRSRSPISTNLQRHPLPSSPSRTHSLSPTRISFRHRLSRPPDENNPGLQGMRMSMRDAPHTIPKRDGRVPTPMLNHDRTKPPPTQDIIVVKREPDVEDSTVTLQPSPSSVLTPAVAPSSPVSSTQLDPIPSPPPPVSVVPMQSPLLPAHVPPTPLSPTESHIADQEPAHRSDMPSRLEEESRNEHSFSVETGADILSSSVPCPSPALAVSPKILPTHLSPQISSSVAPSPKPSQPSANSSLATQACLPVPGLWFAKNGHNQADIVDCEFAVNSETSRKWHLPGSSSAPEATSERLSLRLLCMPIELFQNINQIGSVPQSMDCGALTTLMASVRTVWPEQGSLLVQMNPTKPHKQAWFPEHMSPTSPGLDITDAVREGKNVLRLIQLEDMADKIFVLQASLFTPTSQQSPSTYWNVEDLNLADHLAIYNLSPATVEVI
ncbi:hypothetical protein C0989_000218 [Termitomyces sp. Mn162]|nr:hypothetical protein C0989_000218 [Termitomyces sp. Mn162]